MNLENRMREPIGSLSGGQRQVLSLVMSTMSKSSLLLLDEHTAALDPKMSKKVMEMTNKIIDKQKLTALMITHDMQFANQFGNRLIVMKNGKVQHDIRDDEKRESSAFNYWS